MKFWTHTWKDPRVLFNQRNATFIVLLKAMAWFLIAGLAW